MKKTFFLLLSMFLLLSTIPAFAQGKSPSTINLTVLFKNQKIPVEIIEKLKKKNAVIVSEFPELGAIQVHGSADLIPALQMESTVQSVSPTIIHTLEKSKVVKYDESKHLKPLLGKGKPLEGGIGHDPGSPFPDDFPLLHHMFQWDIKRVTHFGESYQTEKGNHKVVVGIIDTGVVQDHPDLNKNLLGGKNFVPTGGIDGSDLTETGDPTDFEDRNGHGTHVAGTIAGNGQILGVAPEVGFKSYRVFGAKGGAATTTIVSAIMAATKEEVDVISMSLGGYDAAGQILWTDPATGIVYKLGNEVADMKLYKRAIKYAVDHGVTVVAAAGNDHINATNKKEVTEFLNNELGPQGYKFVGAGFEVPGSLPGVITVAATGPDDIKASYSNYGAGYVDVTAPGGDGERYPDWSWYEDLNFSSYLDNDYAFMAGTSMATPKVSAVAALIISQQGKIGPVKVAQKIKDTSEELGTTGKDIYYGNGMVQAPRKPQKLDPMVDWQKNYGGLGLDGAEKIVQTKDGGYLIYGGTDSYVKGPETELYLIKTYADGRIEWRKTLGELGDDIPTDLKPTSDGGFILLNYNTNRQEDGTYLNIVLYKLASDGAVQWKKVFGGKNETHYGKSLAVLKDGYIIAGSRNGDAYLLKTDLSGNPVYEKSYGGKANDSASVVKSTPDGGLIVGGSTYSNGENGHKLDYYVFKVKMNGEKEWEKMYGEGDLINETINDIELSKDGGYILIGSKMQPINEGYIVNYIPSIYYSKINSKGNAIWEKNFGGKLTYEEALSVKATSDGNYILAGSMENGKLNKDAYVLKFNDKGDTIFEKTFGGELSDFASDIQETKDGFILAGNTKSFVNGFKESYGVGGDRDVFIIKLKK